MRLLSERSRQFDLPDLGLASENLNKITNAYKKPFGMILSVGPTGSGKTTTLYAIVKLLNKREVKIMTIEDPVEYEIPGVDQIQVNPKTNLTFAEGLKSIARQDPDIILVGEIRDEETAGIAVNSALTGHLVLSTLHANDAATAFPRMLDFKVEPFLISSTLNLVIAQRLVRKVCTSCRVSQTMETNLLKDKFSGDELLQVFGNTQTVDVFKGKGCPVCFGTGYLGRIGVFEVMEVSDAIRKAINQKEDAETIRQIAVSEGMKTMNQDALQKVKEGITTIEEVIRTTKE
jgi:type II secretory ATPase GspE/PulE/Tfp pilus assembly ATPase PilB-like protein